MRSSLKSPRGFIITVSIFTIILLTVAPPPISRYNNRAVHLSIDDVQDCLVELAAHPDRYESIYDHYFFRRLKILHDLFGAKFTLYIFPIDDRVINSKLPKRFIHDFQNSNDWLHFGFHGIKQAFSAIEAGDSALFVDAYSKVKQYINHIGASHTQTLRLHYWFATNTEKQYLSSEGITTLLTSEIDSPSYSLPNYVMKRLKSGAYADSTFRYLRTEIRIEQMSSTPYIELMRHQDNDTLVIYSHEWFLNRINYLRLARLVEILTLSKCHFIN